MRPLALAALLSLMAPGVAWPQTTAPQASPPQPVQTAPQQAVPQQGVPPAAPPPAADNPGLLNEMGKALEKSLSILPTLKSPSETIDDLNAKAKDVARDAGESLSRLTNPASLVTGRIQCPVSANGAPDCKNAADRLCQSKAFKEGKSLTTDSVEVCSAKVLIPGRARKQGDCRTDNFVTRALCQ